jgi:hypothetical protein
MSIEYQGEGVYWLGGETEVETRLAAVRPWSFVYNALKTHAPGSSGLV